MNETNSKPVIFLAFANDRVEGGHYLRNLPDEKRRIREALEKAEEADLCDVVDLSNTTVKEIFDIFQKQKYKDRIAIFHYGGHAGDYALLLETTAGEHAIAHSEGLDSFLAKQKGLQLIFINGCCSQKQAQDLIEAGVPAVIGTSQKINDGVATDLSVQFYNALAEGRSLDRAWAEAVDLVKTQKGATSYRDLCGEETGEIEDRFPWDIYYRKGAEVVKDWNLPEAVANPLFGLPEIPKTFDLPETPFLFLKRYERQHAEIFFGRSYDIRTLYNRISDPKSDPIILLYGQSGVGKSSLFDAGINPRLEESCTVIYVRRIQEKGLAGTLTSALERKLAEIGAVPATAATAGTAGQTTRRQAILQLQAVAQQLDEQAMRQEIEALINRLQSLPLEVNTTSAVTPPAAARPDSAAVPLDDALFTLLAKWQQLEARISKPLIMILDQVEELYTRPNKDLPDELNDFMVALRIIFGSPADRPRGKLILGYRKEYHPEIEAACKIFRLPRATLFLESLRRKDILDIFRGLTRTPSLKTHYNLSVEEDLPVMVADDLLEDKDSPVAPVLQILLTKMWNAAIKENPTAPRFTVAQYQQLKKEGIAMAEFFEQQMEKLRAWQQEAVDSGLALDVLHFHTTALGTAGNCTLEKLRETYQHRQEIIDALVAKCKELYLLTEAQHNQEATSLTHDTLAPVVISQYHHSDRPGQRAARILINKIEDFNDNGNLLDETDLAIVEQGRQGTRRLEVKENELLELSRRRKMERERERKRHRLLRNILAAAVVLFAVFAAWEWWLSDQNYKKSKANNLAFKAKEALKTDNTKALRIAQAAYAMVKTPPAAVCQILSDAFHSQDKNPFYAANLLHDEPVTAAASAPDGRLILTVTERGGAKLWDEQETLVRDLGDDISSASFSAGGKQILTASRDYTIRLWDTSGALLDSLLNREEVQLANFSTEGKRIVTVSEEDELMRRFQAQAEVYGVSASSDKKRVLTFMTDGSVKLWDEQENLLRDLGYISSAAFSPVDNRLLVASTDGVVRFCDANGNIMDSLKYHAEINQVVFSPDGKRILTASHDHTAKLWDLSQQLVHRLSLRGNAVQSAVFSPEGKHVLTAGFDSTAVLWNEQGQRIASLKHNGVINAARFSTDGKRVLSAGRDSTAKLWTLDESHKEITLQHHGEVYTAVFSPNNDVEILTASADGTAKRWSSNGEWLRTLRHNGEVRAAVFSPDGQHVLTASQDSTAKLWQANGDPITFRHNDEVNAAIFSPRDGSRILTASADSTAKLWRSNGELIKTLPHGSGVRLALYSPEGRYFFTAAKNMAKLWDEEGNLIKALEHKFTVTAAAFSPDEKYILTATAEGSREEEESAVLWNIKGERLVNYGEHRAQVNAIVFSPEGQRFLTASSDGDARIWWLPEKIFAWLKDAPVQRLTAEEKKQFDIGR